MIQLPTFAAVSSRSTFKIKLDGTLFVLGENWNTRDAQWYLDLADSSGNPLAMSVAMSINYYLLKQYKSNPGFPLGDILLYDTKGDLTTAICGRNDLGGRFLLLYFEATDLLYPSQ